MSFVLITILCICVNGLHIFDIVVISHSIFIYTVISHSIFIYTVISHSIFMYTVILQSGYPLQTNVMVFSKLWFQYFELAFCVFILIKTRYSCILSHTNLRMRFDTGMIYWITLHKYKYFFCSFCEISTQLKVFRLFHL